MFNALIVTTVREAVIKVEVANFGAAMDSLIDEDVLYHVCPDITNTVAPFAISCSNITVFLLGLFQKGTS